jgi:hypothetical protein
MHLGMEAISRHRVVEGKLLNQRDVYEVAGDDNLFLIPSMFVLE